MLQGAASVVCFVWLIWWLAVRFRGICRGFAVAATVGACALTMLLARAGPVGRVMKAFMLAWMGSLVGLLFSAFCVAHCLIGISAAPVYLFRFCAVWRRPATEQEFAQAGQGLGSSYWKTAYQEVTTTTATVSTTALTLC